MRPLRPSRRGRAHPAKLLVHLYLIRRPRCQMALEQGVPLWGCNLKNKWAVRPLGIWLLPRGGAGHWGRIILGAGVHRLFCVAESALA